MFKKIVIASALALMASASFAQTAPSVYAGVDVGTLDIDDYDGSETTAGVFVGYNFNENFALEGGYRQAKFDFFKVKQTSLSVIGTLPLSNGFNVYGRLGYNDINTKVTNSAYTVDVDSGAVYGVGAGYAFTPTISGRVEYQKPTSDSSIIMAGLSFKF